MYCTAPKQDRAKMIKFFLEVQNLLQEEKQVTEVNPMKRCMVFLIGFVFLFSLTTFAVAEQTVPATAKKEVSDKEKVTKRQKTGKVVKISDSLLTITFTKKGERETMDFVLYSPEKVSPGERVTVYYIEKGGVKEAVKVKVKEAKETKKDGKKKASS